MGQGLSRALHPDDRQRIFDGWYEAARTRPSRLGMPVCHKTREGVMGLPDMLNVFLISMAIVRGILASSLTLPSVSGSRARLKAASSNTGFLFSIYMPAVVHGGGHSTILANEQASRILGLLFNCI